MVRKKKIKEEKHSYIRAGKTTLIYKIKRKLKRFFKWLNPIEDRTINL